MNDLLRRLVFCSVALAFGAAVFVTWTLWRGPVDRTAFDTPAPSPVPQAPAGVVGSSARVEGKPAMTSPAAAPLPPLRARLLGTVLGHQAWESKAFVQETVGQQQLTLMLGEAFQGRVVCHIARGFIRLRAPSGREESLLLEGDSSAEPVILAVDAERYRVNRRKLAEAVHGDAQQLLTQATLRPHLSRYQLAGFQVTQVKPLSLVEQAGFQDEDIITAVNDTPLDSFPAALALYHAARHDREIAVQITRQGATRTLHYLIE